MGKSYQQRRAREARDAAYPLVISHAEQGGPTDRMVWQIPPKAASLALLKKLGRRKKTLKDFVREQPAARGQANYFIFALKQVIGRHFGDGRIVPVDCIRAKPGRELIERDAPG